MSLSDRSTGRVGEPQPNPHVRTRISAGFANDSPHAPVSVRSVRRRISSHQLERLKNQLTTSDVQMLITLARVRLATGRQLERLHFTASTPPANARRCRRSLERLVHLGLLARLDRRIGGVRAGSSGYVYALDAAGQRLVGPSRRPQRPWTPNHSFVAHLLDVTELYVRLTEAERIGACELIAFQTEPACWRTFLAPGSHPVTLKPDAFVRLGVGEWEHSWFIEIDRSTESVATLTRKFATYRQYWTSGREQAQHGVFPRVAWLVPDQPRHAVLVDVAAAQPEDSWSLWSIHRTDNAVDQLIGRRP